MDPDGNIIRQDALLFITLLLVCVKIIPPVVFKDQSTAFSRKKYFHRVKFGKSLPLERLSASQPIAI